jgi:hypothetical protein
VLKQRPCRKQGCWEAFFVVPAGFRIGYISPKFYLPSQAGHNCLPLSAGRKQRRFNGPVQTRRVVVVYANPDAVGRVANIGAHGGGAEGGVIRIGVGG